MGVTVGRRRDRGFWYVAVHQGGQRARLQCDSEAEARALARHVARLELAGQNVIVALKLARETPPPDPSSPTLRAALPPWIARRAALGEIRHSTAKAYRDRCARWLYEHTLGDGVRVGDLPVTEIRREHLGAVILRIREAGRSRAIVNAIIAPMRRYCAELVEAGVLAVNPAHDLARYLGRLRKPARGLRPLHFSPEESRSCSRRPGASPRAGIRSSQRGCSQGSGTASWQPCGRRTWTSPAGRSAWSGPSRTGIGSSPSKTARGAP